MQQILQNMTNHLLGSIRRHCLDWNRFGI